MRLCLNLPSRICRRAYRVGFGSVCELTRRVECSIQSNRTPGHSLFCCTGKGLFNFFFDTKVTYTYGNQAPQSFTTQAQCFNYNTHQALQSARIGSYICGYVVNYLERVALDMHVQMWLPLSLNKPETLSSLAMEVWFCRDLTFVVCWLM